MFKTVIFFCCSLLLIAGLKGQCPNRDSLWREVNYLKNYSKASPQETRETLLLREKQIMQCAYRYDSTHELLLRAIAKTYFEQEDYLNAIKYLRRSADLINRKANNPAVNKMELVRIYFYLSVFYKAVNNISGEMKALDSCALWAERLNVIDRSVLAALYDRAVYFFDVGDYHRCIEYAANCERKARQYFPVADAVDKPAAKEYALSSFAWQVNSLIQLKQYEKADVLMNSRVNEPGVNSLANYRGTIYGLRAEMEVHKGNYAQSLSIFRQALAWEKQGLGYKQLLNTMAHEAYFKHYKAYDKAISLFRKALRCVNKDPSLFKADSIESLSILSNMAEVYVEQGLYDSAFRCFGQAMDYIKPGISIAEIVNSPPGDFVKQKKVHYLTGLLVGEGNAWRKKYALTHKMSDLGAAVQTYKRADQVVNKLKQEQSNLHSKLFWRSNSHGLYEHALDACYASRNVADAFYFFEKSRAVLLNDQLSEQRWLGEQEILEQTQVKKRLNTLERELNDPNLPTAKRATAVAEKIRSQHILDRLTDTIKARNPFYYQNFIEADLDFVSLPQVQKTILKDYQALIEMFSGDSAVYVMIITAKDARLRKIDKRAYDSLVKLFVSYISNYDSQNRQFETFTTIAHSLYQLIFQQEILPAGRLIVSPDGQYFPFEALLTSIRPLRYFLKDYAVSYTYSARYLLNDFAAAANPDAKSFIGFAPVRYEGTNLSELYESDHSLEALTSYFSTADNFTGKAASRNNFMQQFANYRIIQLYTHASDNRDKGEPVIYFSDSMLYLSDLISDKKPATSLVVLSACETGTGKFYQGEGVFSFNRGFAALGIPAAITSLWLADDRKTYALTNLFYKYLSGGDPADVALQKAKLEFMESSSAGNDLPYFWAVPVLTGKVTAVVITGQSFPWGKLLLAAGIGIILLVFIYRWFRPFIWPLMLIFAVLP
jgi:CHAT domain-containing protein